MLADAPDHVLTLTAQFVSATCETVRLRKQTSELIDALMQIAQLPDAEADMACIIARKALAKALGQVTEPRHASEMVPHA